MTSPRISVGLKELEEHWSFADAYHAHAVLDAIEKAEASGS
jgi:hypothetical protein